MTTTTIDKDKADVYSRPAAQFNKDGQLEIRASAAKGCRRALWYSATMYEVTNPPAEESMTVLEAGNALEPVVLRSMERAGWEVNPTDPQTPHQVSVHLGPNLKVTGHPDATGVMPLFGGETVIEVKTRGPAAFKRWLTLGAERSHPGSVAQAAIYTYGTFGEARDAVIATMDTGSRQWDYEVIPTDRVARALEDARLWLAPLAQRHALNGEDPHTLPARDFSATSWQCKSCPFLNTCMPGMQGEESTANEATESQEEEITIEGAGEAVTAYAAAQQALKEPEQAKRRALATLKAWMRRQESTKSTIEGRTVSLVQTKRYSVNYRKLNALLDPETRSEIVTENTSEYVRVT